MRYRMQLLIALSCSLVSLLFHPVIYAATPSNIFNRCTKIQEHTERLDCYDSLVKKTVKKSPTTDKVNQISEGSLFSDRFAIQAHRQSYFLPLSHHNSAKRYDPNIVFNSAKQGIEVDNLEVKFQFSFKLPIISGLFADKDSINFAYTQLSFWQLYNKKASKPFRENNYEPELIWQIDFDQQMADKLGGLPIDSFSVAFNHQSNGRSNNISLGWNRIVFNWEFSQDAWRVAFKPWIRIPGDEISNQHGKTDHYMGHFDLLAAYKWRQHTFSGKVRNNLNASNNKSYLEFNWAFPITHVNVKGFFQYSYGFGESLIDYDQKINRVSLGILLADWS